MGLLILSWRSISMSCCVSNVDLKACTLWILVDVICFPLELITGTLGTGATEGSGAEDAGDCTGGEATWSNVPSSYKLAVRLGSKICIIFTTSCYLPAVAFGFAAETLVSAARLTLSIFSSVTAISIYGSCFRLLLVRALLLLYMVVSKKYS